MRGGSGIKHDDDGARRAIGEPLRARGISSFRSNHHYVTLSLGKQSLDAEKNLLLSWNFPWRTSSVKTSSVAEKKRRG